MTKLKYEAPTLTKYGKVTDFIEAGSISIATGDVTGDGVADELRGDGANFAVIGGGNGGVTPVTPATNNYYDADGDGLGGIFFYGGTLYEADNSYGYGETAAEDGWDDPARD
ncbi:MAG: hypothetical protein AAGA80_13265 [Cyanobacteria bacterium P01_F01_bin.143]